MEKDTYTTEVIFRVDKTKSFKGTIFALIPYDIQTKNGLISSYQHIGQHSSADYNHCIKSSKPATEIKYTQLKNEMESLGYNIKVITKRNYNKYLTELRK